MFDEFRQHHYAGVSVRHRTTGQTGVIRGQLAYRSRESGSVVSQKVFVRPCSSGMEWLATPADLESYQDTGVPDAD
ncbi:hypothetical protein ACFPK5_07330 [Streptomyces beijiangensis]|uniref:hypothetical protein n=1 Tax=Streptomyces beijiangensis TaxID=163361 RepID=UPI003380CC70